MKAYTALGMKSWPHWFREMRTRVMFDNTFGYRSRPELNIGSQYIEEKK